MRLSDWVAGFDRTPVVPLLGYPGIFLSEVTVEEALTDPDAHVQTVEAIAERFQPDAVFTIMDLTVEAEAAGLPIVMSDREPPSIADHPIKGRSDIKDLHPPDPAKDGRMPVYLDAVRSLAGRLEIPLGAYVIGPFTLAAELAGAEHLAVATVTEPAFVEELLSFGAEVIEDYARALALQGARIIAILEPTSVILSPGFFDRFSLPWLSSVTGTIRECGAFPVLHICGDTNHLVPGMIRTGVDGLSLDSAVDIPTLIPQAPSHVVFIGNVAPVAVMLQGKAETVRRAAGYLLDGTRGSRNFILSSGCDLPLETPHENIDSLVGSVVRSPR